MNLERIRERLANGFKPFVIELSSGKRVSVQHPEFVGVGRGVVAVVGADDSVKTIDALHIDSVEDLPGKRGR
jgi:hypothetical protein